jgi:hypothetical protein
MSYGYLDFLDNIIALDAESVLNECRKSVRSTDEGMTQL